jgi:hypothetical protein
MRAIATMLLAALVAACASPVPAVPTVGPGASSPVGPSPAASGSAPAVASRPSTRPGPTTAPGLARLQPPSGAYFGLNLDWGRETAAEASASLGRTPAVWVQFARFPLDDGAKTNLDAFIDQVATARGLALITLEPTDGLGAITDAAIDDLVTALTGYWDSRGVATFVRFAHEMNGSWYPWAQQPAAYIDAFRRVAKAVHERTPASAMIWAPNQGSGYPFSGGRYEATPGSVDAKVLDTSGDGRLDAADDPYAPYYPGDEAVDWIGVSLYHWGLAYPWGENEMPRAGTFANLLRGRDTGAHQGAAAVPDLYADYATARDKPLAIIETAILYDPSGPASGPTERDLKSAWFKQVFSASTPKDFPKIGMINWFEWRKQEPEVGRVIDWRLASDPVLAQSLLAGVPGGWLRFAD